MKTAPIPQHRPLAAGVVLPQWSSIGDWDITPAIDVVFLLMIFFMLVCQFIGAQATTANLPTVSNAVEPNVSDGSIAAITLLAQPDGRVAYRINGQQLPDLTAEDLKTVILSVIDEKCRVAQNASGLSIRLRCDSAVRFGDVQPVLQAIAESRVGNVEWSVFQQPLSP